MRSPSIERSPGVVIVTAFSTTENLSGEFSCTTVSTPSPHEANARPLSGSNAVPSTPSPMGSVVISLPLSAFTTAISLLLHPANSRRFLRSMASPVGSSQGASAQFDLTCKLFESIAVSSLLSSMLTKTSPFSSVTANSGFPSSLIVLITAPFSASITLAS